MSEVNIKQELTKLDREDFKDVCKLVDKIVDDLDNLLISDGSEVMFGAMRDYMIDLINPDHLDFKHEIYFDLGVGRKTNEQ